ncbi:WRKY transcription factor 19 [Phytophthora nicotianae]|uniref:WRKY transcription factor 19 n=1 Tax=Phytophthora nicotianae TaxID=4792 RepID=A0A0W8B4W9_PHYNI|nr:WRKY transcription factor 19 [Phytophthora nicotianae]
MPFHGIAALYRRSFWIRVIVAILAYSRPPTTTRGSYAARCRQSFRHRRPGGQLVSEVEIYRININCVSIKVKTKRWGSVKCIVEECERRGKSRGLCWAHGGGTKCSAPSCTKVAVSNGCCWAHGGGKRCAYDGCNKAAYERTHNYCAKHHDQLKDGNEVLHV